MDPKALKELLEQVQAGSVTPEAATERLKSLPFEKLGHSTIDHHRALRSGQPEVILAESKSSQHIIDIAGALIDKSANVFITRIRDDQIEPLSAALSLEIIPEGMPRHNQSEAYINREARTASIFLKQPEPVGDFSLKIITAGTSDLPIAYEALENCRIQGVSADLISDVGVAGLHRLIDRLDEILAADFVIVIAGMEGALASVVGGLVNVPVIAVPTSVGYGASFNGVAALLGMLNSCSSTVSVVNIDNGFGASNIACLHIKALAAAKKTG